MIVRPLSGLANRVRVVLSYLRAYNGNVEFVWTKDKCMDCEWSDLFAEPEIKTTEASSNCIATCNAKSGLRHSHFSILVPSQEVKEKVEEFRRRHKKYNSVHIRRTDFLDYARKNGSPVSFAPFHDYCARSQLPVYVSCDDVQTMLMFKKEHGKKVLTRNINWKSGFRQTSVLDALIDAMICVDSEHFLGTHLSSFSSMIRFLRLAKLYQTNPSNGA